MDYHVYVLCNPTGRYYIGISEDVVVSLSSRPVPRPHSPQSDPMTASLVRVFARLLLACALSLPVVLYAADAKQAYNLPAGDAPAIL